MKIRNIFKSMLPYGLVGICSINVRMETYTLFRKDNVVAGSGRDRKKNVRKQNPIGAFRKSPQMKFGIL